MAVVFGGGSALFRHADAHAEDALQRGEDVMARWRVDAATWQAFLALNDQRHQEPGALPNELSIRRGAALEGADVIVGKTAVQVDGSFHALPRRGTPEITRAALLRGPAGPAYVECCCTTLAARRARNRFTLWTGDPGLAVYLWHCFNGTAPLPGLDVVQ